MNNYVHIFIFISNSMVINICKKDYDHSIDLSVLLLLFILCNTHGFFEKIYIRDNGVVSKGSHSVELVGSLDTSWWLR